MRFIDNSIDTSSLHCFQAALLVKYWGRLDKTRLADLPDAFQELAKIPIIHTIWTEYDTNPDYIEQEKIPEFLKKVNDIRTANT